jgi:hypothetical protein
MGLDIYSGQLIRYYTRDWETIIQRYGRENNMEVQVVRPKEIKTTPRDEAYKTIYEWQKVLVEKFKVKIWDEYSYLDYETDKPDWDSYGALILWIINSKTIFKTDRFEKDWSKASLYKKYISNPKKYSEYAHILPDTELWIPVDLDWPIKWVDPGNNEMVIGSVFRLYEQLKLLNSNTWNASEEDIMHWRKELSPDETSLKKKAMFGYSIIYGLAKNSYENKLPMKMDY